MSNKPGISAYQKTNVVTATKESVLLMLYEGAIRFTKQAIEANEKKDVVVRNQMIGKTQDIVNELTSTLDHKVGGELAANLELLYDYITRNLMTGMLEQKTEPLQEALKILENLYEGWIEAVEAIKKETRERESKK